MFEAVNWDDASSAFWDFDDQEAQLRVITLYLQSFNFIEFWIERFIVYNFSELSWNQQGLILIFVSLGPCKIRTYDDWRDVCFAQVIFVNSQSRYEFYLSLDCVCRLHE